MRVGVCWLVFGAALALTGCGNEQPPIGRTVERHPPAQTAKPAPSPDLSVGAAVFARTCLRCHAEGVDGAPQLGNQVDWQTRLAQGEARLVEHAINGHGRMPPKGGFAELSDAEVAAAVAYIVSEGQRLLAQTPTAATGNPACQPPKRLQGCSPTELRRVVVLQLLWALTGGTGGTR